MDLDEWESLSEDCYHDFKEDGEKKILDSESVLDNHFYPTSPRLLNNQLVPLKIPIEPKIGNTPHDILVKEITKIHPFATPSENTKEAADEEDKGSQVFFKIKENEFVDMKIESPKSSEIITSPKRKIEKDDDESSWKEETNSGFNIWKWSFAGVGAICTFGVAAASICVLLFGSQQRKKLDNNIGFQIYGDDKRIKQVVQHATKLNEAISAMRGVPMSTAHITVGGYYDAL